MSQPRPGARPATYNDLLALPEHVVGEIIGGELVVTPRRPPRHAVAASVLGWPAGAPVNLVASIVVAALAAIVYWRALGPLGRLLHRRESAIMQAVTVEQE